MTNRAKISALAKWAIRADTGYTVVIKSVDGMSEMYSSTIDDRATLAVLNFAYHEAKYKGGETGVSGITILSDNRETIPGFIGHGGYEVASEIEDGDADDVVVINVNDSGKLSLASTTDTHDRTKDMVGMALMFFHELLSAGKENGR